MTILHLVRRSAFETTDFEQCLAMLSKNDEVVLLDDGCYNLRHPLAASITNKLMVITPHAQARAIQVANKEDLITMTDLVNLTFKHNSVITWQ